MGTTGTATIAERTHQQSLVFKSLAKRIAGRLRCGLPGIIQDFNPATQYAKVRLAITENLLFDTGAVTPKAIPDLEDVLVLFPGDTNWCLTFPTVVGCECYVCFADMCVNNWATFGFKKTANGQLIAQNQQLQRRHDLSDGFAILAPRSQPKVIPSFSTTSVELRSMSNLIKMGLDDTGLNVTGTLTTTDNVSVGTGANGTFTTGTGQVVTVVDGIIMDIT